MAAWETDGGAATASVAESNIFDDTTADANTTTDDSALDMTVLTGALSEAEKAANRERARDAGWVETVPVDYNIQQTTREDDYAHYLRNSAVYEWDDEYGDIGPEVPELEQDLFGGDFRVRQGQHMDKLQFEVTVEGPDKLQPARSVSTSISVAIFHTALADRVSSQFDSAGLHPVLQEIVTTKMGYSIPTPIQAYTIPAVLSGADVIGISQTGQSCLPSLPLFTY